MWECKDRGHKCHPCKPALAWSEGTWCFGSPKIPIYPLPILPISPHPHFPALPTSPRAHNRHPPPNANHCPSFQLLSTEPWREVGIIRITSFPLENVKKGAEEERPCHRPLNHHVPHSRPSVQTRNAGVNGGKWGSHPTLRVKKSPGGLEGCCTPQISPQTTECPCRLLPHLLLVLLLALLCLLPHITPWLELSYLRSPPL